MNRLRPRILYADKALWKVDNGLLRLNEVETVQKNLEEHLNIQLTVVDASDRFLLHLSEISDPEQKRKTIGKE